MSRTAFVVYEGKTDNVNPAAVYTDEETARADYNQQVSAGLADVNVGLYLAKVGSLSDEEYERLDDNTPALADEGFPGFSLEVLASHESRAEDWNDGVWGASNPEFDEGDSDYTVTV